jgi:NCAIR mutase (PurE)-related protein
VSEFVHDTTRSARIGLPEAIFCAGKNAPQIEAILDELGSERAVLLTRLDAEKFGALPGRLQHRLDYHRLSATAIAGELAKPAGPVRVAIVTGGTSDAAVAYEAPRTLNFHGHAATMFQDIGVAGLWRLLERREAIARHAVVIAIAGMEGALFSVLGGLVPCPIIAVPTSNGYGVTSGGVAALHAALGSCAPGLTAMNIDNGYGAACAALRILSLFADQDRPQP